MGRGPILGPYKVPLVVVGNSQLGSGWFRHNRFEVVLVVGKHVLKLKQLSIPAYQGLSEGMP